MPCFGWCTRRLGDYRLGEVLGEGCFAKVRAGVHRETGKVVAVKIFKSVGSFQREVLVLSRIGQHPNIVRIEEVHANVIYTSRWCSRVVQGLVMQKAICTVRDLLYHGPLSGSGSERLFRQLLEALGHCHQMGVYHRDVKPDNLLVTEEGKLLLSDFNCSTVCRTNRSRCGSPAYMAPEVNMKREHDSVKADVWSAGVCFFEFLVGEPLLEEVNDYSRVSVKIREAVPEISAHHQRVLTDIFTIDPIDRPDVLALLNKRIEE